MIARDKRLHLLMGAIVALAAGALVWLAGEYGLAPAMALAAAAAGVGYEVIQAIRNEGEPDPVDAAYTAVGGVAVAVLGWLLR